MEPGQAVGAVTPSSPVVLADPPRATLLVLLVQGLLEESLARPGAARRLQRIRGRLAIRAGSLWVTADFDPTGVRLSNGRPATAGAWVEGEMDALVAAVTGAGLPRALLERRLAVRGRPRFLLSLARLAPLLLRWPLPWRSP